MRRVVPRGALFALLTVFLAAGCRRPAAAPSLRAEPRSLAERAREIAKVFETPEPYSPRRVGPLDLPAFLAQYPEYRADSAPMADFYARRGRQFAWFIGDSLTAGADAFIEMAGVADTTAPALAALGHRLRELHDEGVAEGRNISLCDSCTTDLELRLTAEFFRFAARNYGGLFSRDLRELNWFIPRAKKDLSRLMDSLAMGKMDLAAFEPVHPQYQLLRSAIQRTRALADLPWPALAIPRGRRKIEVGDTADVVRDIRHRLHQLGDLEADGDSPVHDRAMAGAVERFQLRHGLTTDGVVGDATLRALNVPPADRLRTMLVNIERLRWVPEKQPSNMLLINIPEFRLYVFEADTEVMNMAIVVGAHATRTVIFTSTLSSVVFSPYWNVPPSITRKEILPAIRRDPDYLSKNHMEIIGGSRTAPAIRQQPGEDNPLGRVKFVFPNSYDIFMHDTPARGLFEREQRAFSHGCIRLSQARELAEYLLRDDPSWPPERIGEVMLGERETTVRLKAPRPVLVVYFTSWVDREGRLNFRDDVYGHDRRLAGELFG